MNLFESLEKEKSKEKTFNSEKVMVGLTQGG